MANAFTATRAWRWGGPVGKTFLTVEGTLVIDTTSSGGASALDLTAALFGLSEIIGVSAFSNDADAKGWVGVPDYLGASVMITGGASNAYMDLPNDTYKVTISGFGA
jgi:hypothetical protein